MDGLVLDRAAASVFHPHNAAARERWRARKLAARSRDAAQLLVEVRDPYALTPAEHEALVERCVRANMAIYASERAAQDPAAALAIARQIGLASPQREARAESVGMAWVPWHTQGCRARLLHCLRAPQEGGELALMDAELACLMLHDEGRVFVEALMQPDACTTRAGEASSVFAIERATGDLSMRFSARRGEVAWKRDAVVAEAAARLGRLLERDASCVLRFCLEPGMGLVCNDVLQRRAMSAGTPGLALRATFDDRIGGTEGAWRRLVD
jgi:hypothetical protein